MKLLKGHVSRDSAHVVDGYPYGWGQKCRIRYWLEHKPKFGFRFCSQTEHPVTRVWNEARTTPYMRYGMCMYVDDWGHVQCTGLGGYESAARAYEWLRRFGDGVPDVGRSFVHKWVAARVAEGGIKIGEDVPCPS